LDSFWDFSVKVQTKNRLLINMMSHLNDEQLCHHMELGMNYKLALCCCLKKASVAKDNVALTLADWLNDINRVDGLICGEKAHFHEFALKVHENTRRLNMLAEPSPHTNSSSMTYTNTMNAFNAPMLSYFKIVFSVLTGFSVNFTLGKKAVGIYSGIYKDTHQSKGNMSTEVFDCVKIEMDIVCNLQ
jgi:hypothetical protein